MQMVVMTFRSSMENTVLEWLKTERLSFTYLDQAHGKGKTGDDLGSMYWGGLNTMLFAGIPDEQLSGFRERIHTWQRTLTGAADAPSPVHVFVLPCIQWF
jgi:hypothetical protein